LGIPLILLFFRYQMAVGGGDPAVYRFDRWNGTVTLCLNTASNPLELSCSGKISDVTALPTK
jgi:hypothetical protein